MNCLKRDHRILLSIFALSLDCFSSYCHVNDAMMSLRDPKDGIKQAKNDKPGKHPPVPSKGELSDIVPPLRGQGDVSFCLSLVAKRSNPDSLIVCGITTSSL